MRSVDTGASALHNRVVVSSPANRSLRSSLLGVGRRTLGIGSAAERELFPTYTELSSKVPLRVWQVIRLAGIAGYLFGDRDDVRSEMRMFDVPRQDAIDVRGIALVGFTFLHPESVVRLYDAA